VLIWEQKAIHTTTDLCLCRMPWTHLSLLSRYQSRRRSRIVISEHPNREARVTATVVRPQAWARTMPKLHRTKTLNWG
jgi:hypothetical protein